MHIAYIGLGSNQGSPAGGPEATLTAAIRRLAALGAVQAVSSFYSTEPVGFQAQPPFTNAALALETDLEPAALLGEMLKIEQQFGRDRTATVPKGPRTLDLDILMMDNLVVSTPLLTIPHPALAERRFALTPLAEIAPDAVHPLLHRTIADLLADLPDAGENRLAAVQVSKAPSSPSKEPVRSWPKCLVLGIMLTVAQPAFLPQAQSQETKGVAQGASGGVVVDAQGAPVAGAKILNRDGSVLAVTGSTGRFQLAAARGTKDSVEVSAPGFANVLLTLDFEVDARVILQPELARQSVVVTAYRAPIEQDASPASTRVLSAQELKEAASPALDNKLRMVPGVELFRRSSSLIANPTSQGLSLRGLGSTAASRTLIVADDVPMNDPYGGWIHWDELPELSVGSVEVVRGGASDLYGSSAIGGVVSMMLARPEPQSFRLLSSYGGQNTTDTAVLASAIRGRWSGLVTGGVLRTDGYTLIAPAIRGPVDVPSNVHFQNGLVELERSISTAGRLYLRGRGLNEARSNGTPLQTNATRLWRYSTGAELPSARGGLLSLRLFGSEEGYRQSFSSIGAGRGSESLTRLARTPAAELGAAAHWSQPLTASLLLLVGADTHDVRATDVEHSFRSGQPSAFLDASARQRQTGVYAEVLWTPSHWTLSASGRVDHFSNFDAVEWTGLQPSRAALPDLEETVFDPRVGIARRLTEHLSLTASASRAYRAPTQNELYRTGQVGQETTLPNSALRSERATGWETGFQTSARNTVLRASYFWTQVNRPITALTLNVTPTQILDQRQNLGQIESRGIAIDLQSQPLAWLGVIGGYQFADATVTRFRPQPALVGNWIPQVARNTASAQLRASQRNWGTLSLQARISGHQFDDSSNAFRLHGYFRMDAYADRDLGRHLAVFASAENLFDRTIEVGRTPSLTLGTPLVGRAGIRVRFGE